MMRCKIEYVNKAGTLACLFCLAVKVVCAGDLKLVLNPYEGVNWEKTTQNKSNLHTHTVASGGKLFLNQVFTEYAKCGYTILAITDHDLCTKWEKAEINPLKEFGILPVMGQEYSQGQHVNGFFVDDESHSRNLELVAQGITGHGGFAVINHPGRYWEPDENGQVPQETRDEYLRLLDTNPLVLGIEVINKNNRNPHDVLLWDALLCVSMPVRPVWGFANDDMHERKHIGHAWNVFLLDSLDEVSLRHAMLKGCFYFSVRGHDHEHGGENEPPVIQSIIHDPVAQTLTLSAAADGGRLDVEHFRWIAEGKTVAEGAVLKYGQTQGIVKYVRAEMEGLGGKTYTNPFGFSRVD